MSISGSKKRQDVYQKIRLRNAHLSILIICLHFKTMQFSLRCECSRALAGISAVPPTEANVAHSPPATDLAIIPTAPDNNLRTRNWFEKHFIKTYYSSVIFDILIIISREGVIILWTLKSDRVHLCNHTIVQIVTF